MPILICFTLFSLYIYILLIFHEYTSFYLIFQVNFKPRWISHLAVQDTEKYELKFTRTERWINPLMGWTSSRDPLSNLSIVFPSKQAAINFAVHNGKIPDSSFLNLETALFGNNRDHGNYFMLFYAI